MKGRNKHLPGRPFIFVSGALGEEVAIEALRLASILQEPDLNR
jgi:hypothetical protein